MKTVKITLHDDGSIEVDASGFVGPECIEATDFLKKIFGKTVIEIKKPEYYETKKIADSIPGNYCG